MDLSRRLRSARSLAVLLALVANLVATGIPVLHALAHELAERGHSDAHHVDLAEIDHGHDTVHADALHDAQLLTKRQVVDLAFILPAAGEAVASFSSPARIQHRPPLRLASRAPPRGDLARAPPPA